MCALVTLKGVPNGAVLSGGSALSQHSGSRELVDRNILYTAGLGRSWVEVFPFMKL